MITGFTDKARAEGFIVVYPEGTSRRGQLFTWKAGHCCGYAMEQRVNDVAFIGALIDALLARYPIDPKRVYVTGMSNGAMMAHRLGIELSEKVAAIAPAVGAAIYSVKDNGHAWPGGSKGSRLGDTPSTSLNATDTIWAFFRSHQKP